MKFERYTGPPRDVRDPGYQFVPHREPLTAEDRWEVAGRGPVFGVKMPIACERAMGGERGVLAALGGNPVTINGDKWEVVGVEMFRPAFPIRVGEPVGLQVKPWAG